MKKKIVSVMTAASVVLSSISFIGSTSFAYNDIEGHWAEKYIEELEEDNALEQFDEESLHPDLYLTRAECAELVDDLLRIYFEKPDNDCAPHIFPDLPKGTKNTKKINSLASHYYKSYMTSDLDEEYNPKDTRIINGYPDGLYRPEKNITRGEFAKIVISAADAMGYINVGNPAMIVGDTRGYHENSTETWQHWAHKYLNMLYGLGIMNGYNSYKVSDPIVGTTTYVEFRPDNPITRAEAIKMVNMTRTLKDHYYGLTPGYTTRPPSETLVYHTDYNLDCIRKHLGNIIDWDDIIDEILPENNDNVENITVIPDIFDKINPDLFKKINNNLIDDIINLPIDVTMP